MSLQAGLEHKEVLIQRLEAMGFEFHDNRGFKWYDSGWVSVEIDKIKTSVLLKGCFTKFLTKETLRIIQFLQDRLRTPDQLRKDLAEIESKYQELIMTVSRKYPDESRHATALRYIQEAERSDDTANDALATGESE